MANTGMDGSGNIIFLRAPFGTGVDDTNAYVFGSAYYYQRNSLPQLITLDTSTAGNNRPLPTVVLAGDGLAPLDVNIGAAGTATLRSVLATRHEAAATPLSFRLSDGSAFLSTLPVTSTGYQATATVTRAANTTAYTANDVIGSALTLSSIGPTAGHIIITGIDIILNITAVPSGMGNFLLFLYDVTPPSALTDNAAFSLASGDRASCLTPNGISLGSPVLAPGGGSVVVQANNLNVQVKLASASTTLFAYLVTVAGFTPANASETYSLRVRALGV